MTEAEIRERLDKIRALAHDDERAHAMEDDLLRDFLMWCVGRAGTRADVSRRAALVAEVKDIKFSRWYA